MMDRSVLLTIVVSILFVYSCLGKSDDECGECDEKSCRPPENCLAGMVKDKCGCCYVCGRRESEPCDDEELPLPYRNKNDRCGENLRCEPRTDLAPGDPSSTSTQCVCIRKDALCGSDGVTYDNECQLTEARYKRRDGLAAMHRGPCRSAPKIVSPPEDVSNKTGGHVAMSCEAIGWPIPTIEWRMDRGSGDSIPLPSDDDKVAVQARGGPGKYEVTGWLQLLALSREDEAIYYCIAKNDEGESSASARVYIVGSHEIYNNDL